MLKKLFFIPIPDFHGLTSWFGPVLKTLLITKLAPSHAQSAWKSRGEIVRTGRSTACCNYFSKKKKKLSTIKNNDR